MSESSQPVPENEPFVCDCESWMRDACAGEAFFKEFEGARYCVLHYPGVDKREEFELAKNRKFAVGNYDFSGVWFCEPFGVVGVFDSDVSFRGAVFSQPASFNNAEFGKVIIFSAARFMSSVNFNGTKFKEGAMFHETHFEGPATFQGSDFQSYGYFRDAKFTQADFRDAGFRKEVTFVNATFSGPALFNDVTFSGKTEFSDAKFGMDANFRHAYFVGHVEFFRTVFDASVNFHLSTFTQLPYDETQPKASRTSFVSFALARFRDAVTFDENGFIEDARLLLGTAIFDHPERITFQSIELRPHWFIDTDPRKFNFIRVNWGPLNDDTLPREKEALSKIDLAYKAPLLETTLRRLAVNAEENNRFEEASDFRYLTLVEVSRLQRHRKFDPQRLSWWYWLLSGYGERVMRAFVVLLLIWIFFATTYWIGDASWWQPRRVPTSTDKTASAAESRPLTVSEALLYSAGVLTLQKPEPQPANKRARMLVLAETVVGPIQAALLALAIRRKFMR